MISGRRRPFGAGLLAGILAGLAIAIAVNELAGPFGESDDPAADAREVIEDNYFKEPRPDALDSASIEGMLHALRKRYGDRFSHYFDPEALEAFHSATSGNFSGIGLTVSEVRRGLRVASVIPDTPAERARMQEGDLIVEVDGRSLEGTPARVATALIKGPPGTKVELRVLPAAGGPPRDLEIERATVRIPVAIGRLREADGTDVAYVRFAAFSDGAHGQLQSEIERLSRRGAEGLVLDLRGNGGGLLSEAVLAGSIFVEDGVIATTRSRTEGTSTYGATGGALDPKPMVVLVNRDTASAAEILAGALQHYDLATLVGERTFGKGSVQEVIPLEAGGALDLTVARYFTASGESPEGEGIAPDVRAVDDPQTPRDEALAAALAVLGEKLGSGQP